jgi:DNA polymerase-3 subunit beta
MKFTVDRKVLLDTLNKASFALSPKIINETLKTFVFELENNVLTVSTTDTVTTAQVTTEVFDAETSSFRAILPSDKMLSIARTAHDGEMTFDVAPRKAVITSKSSEWVLNLFDASQYPNITAPKEVPWKPVSRNPFIEAVTAVMSAASFDASSPGLCMVNISSGYYRASDRARMHQYQSDFGVPDLSIPSFSVKPLIAILKTSSSAEFFVVRGKNGFMAKVDNLILTVAGLSAEFPDVTSALLKPTLVNTVEVTVDVNDLTQAIKRTRVTVDSVTKLLSIKVTPQGMSVSTKEPVSNSRAIETVEIGYAGKESVDANVNVSHLYDALNSSPTTTVTMTFGKKERTKLPSVRIFSTDESYNAVISQTRIDIL